MSTWVEKKFGEVTVIANGQVDPKKAPYCGYVHIGPENIESGSGRISELRTATELGLISGKYLFDQNSIVYSKIRPNLNKVCLPNFVGICSADMYPIWPKEGVLDRNYLFYYMKSEMFVKPAVAASMRTGLPKINRRDLDLITVRFPKDISEQKAIAKILELWDEAINRTGRLVEAKEKRYRALAQRFLTGKQRLKNSNSKATWQTAEAGEVFEPVSDRNHPDAPLLAVTQDRGVVPRDSLEGRVMMPSGELNNYKLVQPGDFVISLRSFQGGLEYSKHQGLVSPAYTVLRPKAPINDCFYKHYFKSAEFIGRLAIAVIGIRDGKQISYADFAFLNIPFPALEEQNWIAEILDTALQDIEITKAQAGAFKKQKHGLMQKLLTGEWRVNTAKEENLLDPPHPNLLPQGGEGTKSSKGIESIKSSFLPPRPHGGRGLG